MRILLADDDEGLCRSIKRGLERAGFAVDTASDGPQALWQASSSEYDAVVLDVMLPGLNGFDVCEQMRARDIWSPVLVLTALDDDLDQAEALDLGADDFLSKPVSLVVLTARLRALVRRGSSRRPAVLVAGDLALDPATHHVLRGETRIALSPRQFSLLEFLLRRSGDVMSKSVILEHVWDHAFEGDSNIVEVYVSQLRRKVDEPFDRHAIQTIRGVGYRLDPTGG